MLLRNWCNKPEMGRMNCDFEMIFARLSLRGLINRPTITIASFAASLALAGIALSAPSDSPAPSPAPSPALSEITIYGRVLLENAKPRVASYQIFKNNPICGVKLREIPLIKNNGDALLDTVVFIENAPNDKPFPAAATKVTINQKRCFFEPYLSVIANGGELEIINSDPVLHNIHVYEKVGEIERTIINISQPQRGDITHHVVDADGIALRLTCDAHNFMLGHVFVAMTPYYAVVDDQGNYRISGLAPGTYKVSVWHGVLGVQSKTVTVPASTLMRVDLSY